MERALFGSPRPEALRYVDAFAAFLERFGSVEPIVGADGRVVWAPATAGERAA
jgi:hypothetical protein